MKGRCFLRKCGVALGFPDAHLALPPKRGITGALHRWSSDAGRAATREINSAPQIHSRPAYNGSFGAGGVAVAGKTPGTLGFGAGGETGVGGVTLGTDGVGPIPSFA